MKKLQILIFTAAPFLFTGCFGEDFSFCPPEGPEGFNVLLHFRLPDENYEADLFKGNITRTRTVIYNEAGALVCDTITNENHHNEFQGLRMKLPAGNYRVVSWANSGVLTGLNRRDTDYSHITYSDKTDGVTGNADPLYHAPKSAATPPATRVENAGANEYHHMEVDAATGHESTLDFHQAHRIVEILVEGFSGTDGSTTPDVKLAGLPEGLTFTGLSRHGGLIDAMLGTEMATVDINGREYRGALTCFHTLYLRTCDYDICIKVLDPATGEEAFSVKMNDISSSGPDGALSIIDPNSDCDKIQIVIRFTALGVEVFPQPWGSEDVEVDPY